MIRVLDLFSGIGGISLGLESTGGFETIAFCEQDAFCRLVLEKHWPEVPTFTDVRELRCSPGDADMIAGGFPCQDISVAGKGAGIDGERSGLWREMFRLVRECRPKWVLAENVGALRTRGADRVLADLEAEGYACWPLVVGAWAVGAPHKRERVWIVAHRDEAGQRAERSGGVLDREWAARGDDADGRGARPVGDTEHHDRRTDEQERRAEGRVAAWRASPRWPARPGEPQHEWEEPRLVAHAGREFARPRRTAGSCLAESTRSDGDDQRRCAESGEGPGSPELPLGGAAHGLPERLVRRANREALRAYGNSVVPQVVAVIGRAILASRE
jgi:DNA (cytosine-5)-methyltransferase 1